jgi:hypothetical protein
MGYLIALCIGFALGWLSAALLISGARVQTGMSAENIHPNPGVDPACEICQLMGNS